MKKTFLGQAKNIIDKLNKFESEIDSHRSSLTKNTIDLYTFKKDLETDLSLHRNTLLYSLNEIREKTFIMINDLDAKCNRFELSAEKLCIKMETLNNSQPEIKETIGKVIVLEENFSKHRKNIAAIVDILDKNNMIKK